MSGLALVDANIRVEPLTFFRVYSRGEFPS